LIDTLDQLVERVDVGTRDRAPVAREATPYSKKCCRPPTLTATARPGTSYASNSGPCAASTAEASPPGDDELGLSSVSGAHDTTASSTSASSALGRSSPGASSKHQGTVKLPAPGMAGWPALGYAGDPMIAEVKLTRPLPVCAIGAAGAGSTG
jgi:hypothetical protein